MPKTVNVRRDIIKDWNKKFGLEEGEIRKVKTLEELKSSNLGIVVGEAVVNFTYSMQVGQNFVIKKGEKYIMSLNVFKQLWCDPKTHIQLLKPSDIKFKNIYKSYRGHDLTNKKVLFMRHGGIGDLLFINPFAIYLQKKYPSCKIAFCSGHKYRPMLENWDFISDIYSAPMKFSDFTKYDYHVIFEGTIERNEEAEHVNVYELFNNWLELDVPKEEMIPYQKSKNVMLTYCRDILHYNWNLKEKDFILLQTTASSPIRTPSLEIWTKIINKLTAKGHNIVLSDSKPKKEIVDKLIAMLDHKDKVFNFAEYSNAIDDGIAMIDLSKLVIAPDSSGTHIAASLNIPMVGIFGSFEGHVRLTTYKNADWIDAKRECTPCYKHGYMPCEFTSDGYHPLCFDNINENEVLEKVERLLEK